MVPAGIHDNSIVVTKGVLLACNRRHLGGHLNDETRVDGLPLFITAHALYSVEN